MDAKTKQLITDYIRNRKPDAIDSVLENALFDAEHEVLDHCHINEITDAMIYVTSKIVLAIMEHDEAKITHDLDADTKGLKSIRQGDTTLEFANVTLESNKQIIDKHRSELNKFRKLVF